MRAQIFEGVTSAGLDCVDGKYARLDECVGRTLTPTTLQRLTRAVHAGLVTGGVYTNSKGPRFETKAEVRLTWRHRVGCCASGCAAVLD